MSLTSYRAAPSRGVFYRGEIRFCPGFFRFGGDLLSHVLGRSTIGAAALNDRVRNGTGCFARAVTTKPEKARCCMLCIQQVQCSVFCFAKGAGWHLVAGLGAGSLPRPFTIGGQYTAAFSRRSHSSVAYPATIQGLFTGVVCF